MNRFISDNSGSARRTRQLRLVFVAVTLLGLLPGLGLGQAAQETEPPIRVGGGESYAPYHFIDDNGEPAGFDIDLVRAVARTIGRQVEIRLGPWQNARSALEAGDIDVLAGMSYSDERDRRFDFSAETLKLRYRIVIRSSGTDISSEADLRDREIITQRASLMEPFALGLSKRTVLVDSGREGLQLLASGRHDCYLGSEYRALHLMQELGLHGLLRVGEPVLVERWGFAVREGRSELLAQLDQGIAAVKRSGEYDDLYQRWFIALESVAGDLPRRVARLAWVILPALGALLLLVIWLWTLRRQVVARTRDLQKELVRRKEVETALRESEERFSKAFRYSPEPIVILSLADDTILEVNEAFEHVTGYSRHELVDTSAADIGIWSDPDSLQQASSNVEESRPLLNLEMHLRHRSGETRVCLCSMSRIQVGSLPCLLLVAADITEHKRLESQLAQTSKLEALGQLAGGVAHDFNNLLSVIQGYSELTLLSLEEGSPQWQHLKTVLDAASRGSDLTRQMLAFSRQQKQNPVPIDLNTVVRNTKPMIRRLIGERFMLRYVLREDLGLVEVDPGQISQVIINLVINARDAMGTGGTITFETSEQVLEADDESGTQRRDSHEPGTYAVLEVRDTGHGIDAEHLPHIFEPFYTTKAEGEGTGLGLATVYGIVKQSGGFIEVQSSAGRGAAFTVYLPYADVQVVPEELEPESLSRLSGSETILLVEDEQQICKLMETTLSDRGYRVLSTTDPQRALQFAEEYEGRIDLLLTDVVMPGMTGIELAALIRDMRVNTKVLYISGYTDDPLVRENARGTEVAFLAKPFTIVALAHRVREVLDSDKQ